MRAVSELCYVRKNTYFAMLERAWRGAMGARKQSGPPQGTAEFPGIVGADL